MPGGAEHDMTVNASLLVGVHLSDEKSLGSRAKRKRGGGGEGGDAPTSPCIGLRTIGTGASETSDETEDCAG